MPPDQYGRAVSLVTANGFDTYTVTNDDTTSFIVQAPQGTDQATVYNTINAMAPSN